MKRAFSFLVVLALLAIAIVPVMAQECMDELGCVVIGADDPITIGYMLVLSGANESLGSDSLMGAQLAFAERDNMFMDHEIEFIGEDSLCSTEGGQAAAQRLVVNEDIVAIIGSSCSSEATAGLPLISEAGMLMLSPSNTSPRLTTDDPEANGVWQPGYYRTAHNDLFQGAIVAEFAIHELEATTMATIHDGSAYAQSLQEVAADVFAELGGEVVFQGAVNVGDTDMTAILTEIAASSPDVLYLPIFQPESSFVVSQAKNIPGLEDTILMSADGSFSDDFPENTGEAVVGMYLSGPAVAGEAYDAFLAAWDEEFGGVPPSVFHAHAYDAANILLTVIEEVAVVGDDGSLTIGRQALRDALTALEGYEGLTGVLGCDEYGDCATGEALGIFQVTQAELDGAWPPALTWTLADIEE